VSQKRENDSASFRRSFAISCSWSESSLQFSQPEHSPRGGVN
jgi:hypothetical protein